MDVGLKYQIQFYRAATLICSTDNRLVGHKATVTGNTYGLAYFFVDRKPKRVCGSQHQAH